jgi:hypothetical protein
VLLFAMFNLPPHLGIVKFLGDLAGQVELKSCELFPRVCTVRHTHAHFQDQCFVPEVAPVGTFNDDA